MRRALWLWLPLVVACHLVSGVGDLQYGTGGAAGVGAAGGAGGTGPSTGGGGMAQTCDEGGDACPDGLLCVDGVCCNSACEDECMACDTPDTAGTCAPALAGSSCDTEGFQCDGTGMCALGALEGVRILGNAGDDVGHGVAVAQNGDTWVGGSCSEAGFTFGDTHNCGSPPGGAAFYGRINAAGNADYSFVGGETNDPDLITAVAADEGANSRLFFAGGFTTTVTFSGSADLISATGFDNMDAFALSTENSGNGRWSWSAGEAAAPLSVQQARAIAVSPDNQTVVVAGVSEGDSELGAVDDDQDAFVVGLENNAGGTAAVRWMKQYDGGDADAALDVTFATGGSIWLVGEYDGALDLGVSGVPSQPAGTSGGFVVKLSAETGSSVVGLGFGGSGDSGITAVAPFGGGVVIAGYASGNYTFADQEAVAVVEQGTIFVAALDGDANVVWFTPIMADAGTTPRDIAVDDDGFIAVVGDATGDLTVGADQHSGDDTTLDAWVILVDPNGYPIWLRADGAIAVDDRALGVAIDPTNGEIVVVGSASTNIFGGTGHATGDDQDVFVARFTR